MKKEIPEEGKDINLYGRIILGVLGSTSFLAIFIIFGMESQQMKWFWIIYLVLVFGFQFLVEWKYLRETKMYLASLAVMFIGVSLANFLF